MVVTKLSPYFIYMYEKLNHIKRGVPASRVTKRMFVIVYKNFNKTESYKISDYFFSKVYPLTLCTLYKI